MKKDKIVIIDLGSTKNVELAREIRALGIFSEIHPHDLNKDDLDHLGHVKGFILYGGPNNIIDGSAIEASDAILDYGLPILYLDYAGHEDLPEDPKKREVILKGFIFQDCQAESSWSVENFIETKVKELQDEIGEEKVLLALSGGVDSSVVAALLIKAIGKQLTCVHVNHGLLRQGESEQVVEVIGNQLDANLIYIDASEEYMEGLAGVSDPEEKRKIIGALFIDVFEKAAEDLDGIKYLAQGTIYSDIIESGTKTQKAIKSHHNVGGLPEEMELKLVEPISALFKDEVRQVGLALGLPEAMVFRQPFPGPGLGVRCVGAITKDRLEALRHSDAILREEFQKAGLDRSVWQFFTVIPDIRSTGIKDGERSFEWPCIIRAVNSVDAMTAEIEEIPYQVLHKLTDRITHEVKGVNRVLYDLTPKPTGTVEWE